MKQIKRGVLISFEGIDGSGKTSLIANAHQHLMQEKFPVLMTKEPGGSALGKQLRILLQEQPVPITSKAEFLLFAADRAQHFTEVIIPNLDNKKIILSDRLADSSVVYQGYGRGLDIKTINNINAWVMDGIQPDLTFYVRINAQTAFERIRSRNEQLTAFEQEKTEFFNKLIDGFDTLLCKRESVITLDGTQAQEALLILTISHINDWLIKNTLYE